MIEGLQNCKSTSRLWLSVRVAIAVHLMLPSVAFMPLLKQWKHVAFSPHGKLVFNGHSSGGANQSDPFNASLFM